jgi:NTP pyrophosphatase (non-canonical NTP hydrolase)
MAGAEMSQAGWDLSKNVERLMKFREARDWKQFHRPKELAAAIAIEAGELQELFLWRDAETAEIVSADPARMEKITQEIADVASYLVMLTHDLGVDLSAAIEAKVAANERRYPADQHRGVARKAGHAS